MAKQPKSKVAQGKTTGRNGDRPNGKAWSRFHENASSITGHRETGRTKPTGRTIGGHSRKKLGVKAGDHLIDATAIRESREHSHRVQLRNDRKVAIKRAASASR